MGTAHQLPGQLARVARLGMFQIADPGAGKTFYMGNTNPIFWPVTTAAAEARTLNTPTGPGQVVVVSLAVDGGDCTLTVTNGYDQDGNTVIVMDDAGDFAAFCSVKVASAYRWRVLASCGVYRKTRQIQCWGNAKVGATAGWTVNAASNRWSILCPASQTAATLVIPVEGLRVGDKITAFKVIGQAESAGGALTLDADLRKLTGAAADLTDASVGAITQIAKTVDYLIADAKTGLAEVVAENETFYVLLTATTAALTDIDLQGVTISVQQQD